MSPALLGRGAVAKGVSLVALAGLPQLASGQTVPCSLEVQCSTANALDAFGEQIAIDGEFAVLGAPSAGTDGAVCVFRFDGTDWVEDAVLTSPNATGDEDGFGYSVTINGNDLIVGAPFEGAQGSPGPGAAYVFRRTTLTGTWVFTQRLEATGVTSGDDRFGIDVDSKGPYLVIGAVGDDTVTQQAGAAYTYRKANGQWIQEAKLLPTTLQTSMRFGLGVAVQNQRAIVGCPFEDVGNLASAGAAYVFQRQPNTTWTLFDRVTQPTPQAQAFFGVGVDIRNPFLVVGAEGANNGAGANSGLAFAFRETVNGFILDDTLAPSSPMAGETFGNQVAISGTTILASARGDNSAGTLTGAAHQFERVGGSWPEVDVLVSPSAAPFQNFSSGVAISDEGIGFVGAPGTSSSAPNAGAGVLFDLGVADCNGNGEPDSCDIVNGVAVDCNQNGIPDSCDIFTGAAADCNGNGIPDGCDLITGTAVDCNGNGVPDVCDIASGFAQDCNLNAIPDSCDIASGVSEDCNGDGIPDECQVMTLDCNSNGIIDACEIASGLVEDENGNLVPDECEPLGAPYCTPGAPNSANQGGGTLRAFGSPQAGVNDVILKAEGIPIDEFGFFLNSRSTALVPFPQGSSGILCLGGSIGRFNSSIQNSGLTGVMTLVLDQNAVPRPNGLVAVMAGQTWYFQAWHRDVLGTTQTSNFTAGLEISFQ